MGADGRWDVHAVLAVFSLTHNMRPAAVSTAAFHLKERQRRTQDDEEPVVAVKNRIHPVIFQRTCTAGTCCPTTLKLEPLGEAKLLHFSRFLGPTGSSTANFASC
jgi:hypothetical protein